MKLRSREYKITTTKRGEQPTIIAQMKNGYNMNEYNFIPLHYIKHITNNPFRLVIDMYHTNTPIVLEFKHDEEKEDILDLLTS